MFVLFPVYIFIDRSCMLFSSWNKLLKLQQKLNILILHIILFEKYWYVTTSESDINKNAFWAYK